MEMAMLMHVWAIAHRRMVQVHLFHQAALHKEIQAVIDRRHGNIGHPSLRPHENLLRRRMIPLLHQDPVDVLPLRRQAKAFGRQARHFIHSGGFRSALH